MIKVGFTGTRAGMTDAQKQAFKELLKDFYAQHEWVELHHGDCVGADAEAHDLTEAHVPCGVVIHPPKEQANRAHKRGDVERPPQTHFARNRAIVDWTDILVAAPLHDTEQDLGGTWYTVRYARKQKKRLVLIWPNGVVEFVFPPVSL